MPPPNLGEVFRRLREKIASRDTHTSRDERILADLAGLLLCKIADEQRAWAAPARPLRFRLGRSRADTARAIRALFEDVKRRLCSVFDAGDRLHLDDASLETVVATLAPYRLLGHDRQAVGAAFQVLRGRAQKGEEGAYFTPAPIVDCVVRTLDPQPGCRTIDPACGTGGFLAAALDHVFARIDATAGSRAAARRARRRVTERDLHAADKDALSALLCRAYLTLLGDGQPHVYRADWIDRREWSRRGDDLVSAAADGTFDLVMTNPPFGKNLTVSAEVGRAEGLLVCRRWRRRGDRFEPGDAVVEQQLGLAVFERALELLRPGGQMAIVLPETFLFSKSFRWFVDWLCARLTVTHVVDLPMVAFEEFCRAKTCLLFVSKREPPPDHEIVMSFPATIGQDRRGAPLRRLDRSGRRTGARDDELAEAATEIARAGRRGARESRLCFRVAQSRAGARGVLVPRFWWRRDAERALRAWARRHPSEITSLGELADRGVLRAFGGHGSPPGNARATGGVPYVKVTDLKNWRINENPTNFIHERVAAELRRGGPALRGGDLVTPARASANIGQFSLVLPWQTHVVLTKEVLVLRVLPNGEEITPCLMLALLSLGVVQGQVSTLALMQTNREHLGDHWREMRVPLPDTPARRRRIAAPVADWLEAQTRARRSWKALSRLLGPESFGTGP